MCAYRVNAFLNFIVYILSDRVASLSKSQPYVQISHLDLKSASKIILIDKVVHMCVPPVNNSFMIRKSWRVRDWDMVR